VSFGVARRKKRRSGEGIGFGLIFIGGHCAEGEREREGAVTGRAQDGGRRLRALRVHGSRSASAARRG
jgi:hypothetical protein